MKDITNQYFNQKIFILGQRGPKDVVSFRFPFMGKKEDIRWIKGSCGCMDAYYEDGFIKGVLDLSKAGTYKKGSNSVNKYVTVMMNDGESEHDPDEMLRWRVNENKTFCRLQVAATIYI